MLYSFTVDFVRSSVFRPEHQTLLVRISELRECYRVSSALSRPVLPKCAAPAILPKTHTSLTSLSLASNSQPRLVESSTGELDRRWLWFCLVECRVLVFSQCSAVSSNFQIPTPNRWFRIRAPGLVGSGRARSPSPCRSDPRTTIRSLVISQTSFVKSAPWTSTTPFSMVAPTSLARRQGARGHHRRRHRRLRRQSPRRLRRRNAVALRRRGSLRTAPEGRRRSRAVGPILT